MALDRIKAKTGNAKTRKLGHTASNQYGNDITAQPVGRTKRDLSAK